jgi:anaerobic selenocysteine-containing dehydrogenase
MDKKNIIKSTCKGCHGGCGVLVTVENGAITYIEGDPESFTRGTMCAKGLASIQEVSNPNRLKYPIKRIGKRGEGKWQRIDWEEAIETIAGKIKNSSENYGENSVLIGQGTSRGHNRYTYRLARSIGTTNYLSAGYFCIRPRIAVSTLMIGGSRRLFCDYYGWGGEFPKTQISWGRQMEISNADGEMRVSFLDSLKKAKNLILVDPRATALAKRATLWLQLRPGTDAALALGMMNVIINEGIYDKEFVENWTYGFEKLKQRVKKYSPEKVAEITWIPKEKIIQAARIFAVDTPGVILIGQALEASNNSVQNIRSLFCLLTITGNIERPGSMMGWLPPATGPLEEFALEVPMSEEHKKTAVGADK